MKPTISKLAIVGMAIMIFWGCNLNKTITQGPSPTPKVENKSSSNMVISDSKAYGMKFERGAPAIKKLPKGSFLHLLSYAGGDEGSQRIMHWIERDNAQDTDVKSLIESTDYNAETKYPADNGNFNMGTWFGVTKERVEIMSDKVENVNGMEV